MIIASYSIITSTLGRTTLVPFLQQYYFDAELLGNVIIDLKRGKAAGLDTLTAEHLQNSHCLLPCVLAELFNLILRPTSRIFLLYSAGGSKD